MQTYSIAVATMKLAFSFKWNVSLEVRVFGIVRDYQGRIRIYRLKTKNASVKFLWQTI